jgi:anti-anti-sigma factor
VVFRAALKGGDYDVFRREELRAELSRIEADTDIEIDLSSTTFMDAGAVGLLISFRRRILEKNRRARVRLIGASPIVRRGLQLSKAEELFDFAP